MLEHRLHQHVRVVNELRQLFAVSIHVGDGAFRHAAVHGRLRHGGCDARDQARVERFWDQVLGAKGQVFFAIYRRHFIGLFGLGQLGDGIHGRAFHGFVDGGCTDIQRTAENVGEAQARCSPGSDNRNARSP